MTISYPRVLALALLCAVNLASARAAEKVVDGVYYSPLKNFSVPVPKWGRLRIQDRNDDDFAIVTFLDRSDLPAPLRSIICLRLPTEVVPTLGSQERRDEVYEKFLTAFVMPHVFQNVAPNTTLERHEYVEGADGRALFAVVNIPEGHTSLHDPKRRKQADSVSGLLIFHHKEFMYLLRTEMKTLFNSGLQATSLTPGDLESARKALAQFRSSMRFAD